MLLLIYQHAAQAKPLVWTQCQKGGHFFVQQHFIFVPWMTLFCWCGLCLTFCPSFTVNKVIVGFRISDYLSTGNKSIFSIKTNCITNSLCQFCPIGVFLCTYYTFLHSLHQKVLAQCFTGMKQHFDCLLCWPGYKTSKFTHTHTVLHQACTPSWYHSSAFA